MWIAHHKPCNYLLIMSMVDLGLHVWRIVHKDLDVVKKLKKCEKGSYKNQV